MGTMGIAVLSKNIMLSGNDRHLIHFLAPFERFFLRAVLPWVPLQVSTVHLTLMTVIWSAGIVIAGYLSAGDMRWLWLFDACLLMQYMTDMLDGEVGRSRNTGLIQWGFYMDHFLDYIFLCAAIIGYSFLLPPSYFILVLLCLGLMAGFMVHTFLDFAITHKFKISMGLFGVSEMRMFLVFLNILLILFGKGLLIGIFPGIVLGASLLLFFVIYRSQIMYRHIDVVWQAMQENQEN
jgi:phosphatidylglycerophosphate synthase